MRAIAKTNCEDCGAGFIISPELLSISKIDDRYTCFWVCGYCKRVKSACVDESDVDRFVIDGVELIDWR